MELAGELSSLSSPPPVVEGSRELLSVHPPFGQSQTAARSVGFQEVDAVGQPIQ